MLEKVLYFLENPNACGGDARIFESALNLGTNFYHDSIERDDEKDSLRAINVNTRH